LRICLAIRLFGRLREHGGGVREQIRECPGLLGKEPQLREG
jgi:hypothetical protein